MKEKSKGEDDGLQGDTARLNQTSKLKRTHNLYWCIIELSHESVENVKKMMDSGQNNNTLFVIIFPSS